MPGLKREDVLTPMEGEFTKDAEGKITQTSAQAQAQANRVFGFLKAQIESHPNKKLALLYAASNKQAKELHKARAEGHPIPGIDGSGQAQLFKYLIPMINAEGSGLKGKVQILPIATSVNGGNNTPGNRVTTGDLNRDLGFVKQHIKDGYEVLGIPGKVIPGKEPGYAIGGGVSKHFYDKTSNPINGKSQGEYVQEQLKLLEQGQKLKLADTNSSETRTLADVYSKLDPGLKDIVDEYKKVSHANGETKLPSIDKLEDKHVIVFHFDNAESAEKFFKDQAEKSTPGKSFDMMFKGQDRRMYSDGTGKMVIGTKQEVDDYITKKEDFTVDEHGHLSRNAATAGAGASPASSASPPASSSPTGELAHAPDSGGVLPEEPSHPSPGSGSGSPF